MTIRGRAIAGAGHIDCSVGLSHGSKEGGTLDFGLTMLSSLLQTREEMIDGTNTSKVNKRSN